MELNNRSQTCARGEILSAFSVFTNHAASGSNLSNSVALAVDFEHGRVPCQGVVAVASASSATHQQLDKRRKSGRYTNHRMCPTAAAGQDRRSPGCGHGAQAVGAGSPTKAVPERRFYPGAQPPSMSFGSGLSPPGNGVAGIVDEDAGRDAGGGGARLQVGDTLIRCWLPHAALFF